MLAYQKFYYISSFEKAVRKLAKSPYVHTKPFVANLLKLIMISGYRKLDSSWLGERRILSMRGSSFLQQSMKD